MSKVIIENIFYVSLTILVAFIVNAVIKSFIKVPKRIEDRRQKTFLIVIRNIISVLVYAIALFIIFDLLEINLTPLLTSAGIIGLSIGLGAKPLIEDLIGGMMLLSQDSIAIGDDVEIEGSVGKIERIGFRTLNIRAKDGSLHIIPNGMVKKVINYSKNSSKSKLQTSEKNKK